MKPSQAPSLRSSAQAAPGTQGIVFRVVNIAIDDPIVMTERVNFFRLPDNCFELPVIETFDVSDDKISAWRRSTCCRGLVITSREGGLALMTWEIGGNESDSSSHS